MEGQIEIKAHFLQNTFRCSLPNATSKVEVLHKKRKREKSTSSVFFTFHAINSESFCFCFDTLNPYQNWSSSKTSPIATRNPLFGNLLRGKGWHTRGMGQTKVESTQRRTAGQIKVLHWRRESWTIKSLCSFSGPTLCASLYSHPMHKPPNKVVDCNKIAVVLTYTYILTYTSWCFPRALIDTKSIYL